MKKIVVIIILLVAVIAAGWTLTSNKKKIDSRMEVKTVDQNIMVTVAKAENRAINNQLDLVGTTEADKEAVVSSEIAGKITQINFKLGDYVAKGAVLARVDDTYKRLAMENAQINFNKSKEDYERYQILQKGDAVSEIQLRDMKVTYENNKIQLENATKQYDDTRIIAPFGGYVTSKRVELGTYVSVATPVVEIADIAQLKVILMVSETNVYALRPGQEVEVKSAVYNNVSFPGKVSHISPKGDNAHTYPVEVLIANSKEYPLKAGTYVNVHVDMGKIAPSLMIPRDAIVSSVKDPSVYLVKGDVAQLTKVSTGNDYGSYLEIISGLKEGDQVVTNGQINLMDGAKIAVINN